MTETLTSSLLMAITRLAAIRCKERRKTSEKRYRKFQKQKGPKGSTSIDPSSNELSSKSSLQEAGSRSLEMYSFWFIFFVLDPYFSDRDSKAYLAA